MTNTFYSAPASPTDFTLARSVQIRTQWAAIEAAFDLVSATDAYVEAGGTANALTVTLDNPPVSYVDGFSMRVKIAADNTAPPTINVSGLGATPIVNFLGMPLADGDLVAGTVEPMIFFDGSFRVRSVADAVVLAQALAYKTAAQAAAQDAQDAQAATEQAMELTLEAEDVAMMAAMASGYYPGARSYVPQGAVTGAATVSVAGSGGTNGTFDLAFSGGNFAVNPTGTFTVAGGIVTAINITGPGLYIGNAISKPTLLFTASAGLGGGPSGTFNTVYLKTAGQYYLTDTSPASAYLALFQNQANAAVEIDAQFDPMSAGKAAAEADRAAAEAAISVPLTDGYSRDPLVETYVHGVTSVNGTTGPAGLLWLNNPAPHSGLVSKVKGWARTAGATEVHFHSQNSDGERIYRGKVTFTVAGASADANDEWDVSAQAFRIERGWFMGWNAGARVAVASTPASLYSATAPTDGTPIVPSYVNNYPAFSIEIDRDTIETEGAVKDAIDTIPLAPIPCVHFLSPSNTARIREVIANIRKGITMSFEDSLVLGIGDSNLVGAMVGTNNAYTASFDRNWLAKLADQLPLLTRNGGLNIPTQRDSSFMGTNNPQGAYTLYNPNCISLGAWAVNGTNAYLSIGGGMFVSTTVGGAVAEWRIADDVSTIKLGFPLSDILALGTFQCSTDGGATWDYFDQSGSEGYDTATLTPDPGVGRTIQFKHTSGTTTAFHAMFSYDSATPSLNFINGANAGSLASTTWASFSNPWGPLSLLRNQAAALKVFMLGSNDLNNGVTLDTYLLWMRRLIFAGLAKSDVMVITPPPIQDDGNANRAQARQNSFYAGLYGLCKELNVPLIGMSSELGTWAQATASGLMGALPNGYIHLGYAGDDLVYQKLLEVFERLG